MNTIIFIVVMLHLVAGFGYFVYKLEFQKNNKKSNDQQTKEEEEKLDNT
jgi:flagellar basal body-associated protein FliL